MGINEERDLDDRWLLGLRGRSVESVEVHEFNVDVAFGIGTSLTIESSGSLRTAPGAFEMPAVSVSTAGTISVSDALLSLIGERVLSSVGFKTGSLRLAFESGAQLRVPFNEHYEAWQVTGPSGRIWVSTPGGGLTTFS